MQVPVAAIKRRPAKGEKAITWLAVVLLVGVAWECLTHLYFVREMFVFVMLTAKDEYKAYSTPIGNTIVFGGAWTLKIPKGDHQAVETNLCGFSLLSCWPF